MAAKFFDHFLYIARAMTDLGGTGIGMWDYADEFYYDELVDPAGKMEPLRVRSMVGLVPLLAVEVLGPETLIRPRSSGPGWSGPWSPARTWPTWCPAGTSLARAIAGCCRCSAGTG